jgi:hypothetical protein
MTPTTSHTDRIADAHSNEQCSPIEDRSLRFAPHTTLFQTPPVSPQRPLQAPERPHRLHQRATPHSWWTRLPHRRHDIRTPLQSRNRHRQLRHLGRILCLPMSQPEYLRQHRRAILRLQHSVRSAKLVHMEQYIWLWLRSQLHGWRVPDGSWAPRNWG